MGLLHRYVCRQFLRFFWLGLAGCVALFLVVELFDRMDEFLERRVFWSDVLRYLLFKSPGMVYQMMPAAFLLSSVLTFSTLNRHNEIVAVRAGGMAPLRLAWPLFCLGGIGCVVLLVAQEYLLPYTNHTYHLIWRTRIQREKMDPRLGLFKQGQSWYRAMPRLWSVQQSQPLENRFLGVSIYELDATGAIRRRYDAAEARWDPQGWVLQQGTLRAFETDGAFAGPPEDFVQRRFDFPERPTEMSAVKKRPEEMSLHEMQTYIRQLQHQGVPTVPYLVEFHGKLAFAVVCIIMAGFGVPLALRLNRSGGTGRAIGLTLCCGLGYWIVHSTAMAFGQNGLLPPVFSAWSTNIGFGIGSVYLSYRLQ
jgi:lipopolysaccharide export system permease protein